MNTGPTDGERPDYAVFSDLSDLVYMKQKHYMYDPEAPSWDISRFSTECFIYDSIKLNHEVSSSIWVHILEKVLD
jgi:hypothetical protein